MQAASVVRAALLLATLLTIVALGPALLRSSPVCSEPRELESREGWTSSVLCGAARDGGCGLRGPAILLFGGRLDLNRVSARALEVVPGIGPTRAQAIAQSRSHRPFERWADVDGVRGIGPRTLDLLREWAELSPTVAAPESSVACRVE